MQPPAGPLSLRFQNRRLIWGTSGTCGPWAQKLAADEIKYLSVCRWLTWKCCCTDQKRTCCVQLQTATDYITFPSQFDQHFGQCPSCNCLCDIVCALVLSRGHEATGKAGNRGKCCRVTQKCPGSPRPAVFAEGIEPDTKWNRWKQMKNKWKTDGKTDETNMLGVLINVHHIRSVGTVRPTSQLVEPAFQ